MTRFAVLLLTLLLTVQPADPPHVPPSTRTAEPPLALPVLQFPVLTPNPAPPTPLPPGTIPRLTVDLLYATQSKGTGEIILIASPAELVKITRYDGPLVIRGKFVDGTGQYETRTYAGPIVYTVEAVTTGRVELLGIPAGFKSEADIQRQRLDVGGGPAPDPIIPPGPPPDGPLGLVLSSWTGRQKVTTLSAADKARDAAALARSHRSIASAIAAGAYNQHATPQALAAAILADKKAGNLAVVTAPDGTVRTDWRPWGAVIDPVVGALYAAGRLNTKADWQAALEEIARGLD